MRRRETLKGEVSRIGLKRTKTGEGEAPRKEKAIVTERKGVLTETQSSQTGTEKHQKEIEKAQTKTENLQTGTGKFQTRRKGGADHETGEDLGQDQESVHQAVVESPQTAELQGKGLAAQAGGMMGSQEDQGQRSAPQDQGQRNAPQDLGQKDVHRSRLRGRGLGKVATGHARALKNFWMPPVGLTGQKRPRSG